MKPIDTNNLVSGANGVSRLTWRLFKIWEPVYHGIRLPFWQLIVRDRHHLVLAQLKEELA